MLHSFTCIFARKVIFIAKLPQCFLIPSDSLSCSLDVMGLSVVLCDFLSPLPASYLTLVLSLFLRSVVDLFVFGGAYVYPVICGSEPFRIREEVVTTVAPAEPLSSSVSGSSSFLRSRQCRILVRLSREGENLPLPHLMLWSCSDVRARLYKV